MRKENISEMESRIDQMFKSLSDEEFVSLLGESGFEVMEGNGEIIYEDPQTEFEVKTNYKLKGNSYSYNFGKSRKKINISISSTDVALACAC
ncbi:MULTISPECIES: hypothetical protein [Bacillus cereus group]|uniref:hypothetical protein n=1 Tax=Bacillus cereus group TaxID=86661 RepID=UPI000BF70F43|nr:MULTISPECIES: hypothetical protein [Bacillus cereus group]MCU7668173.1 hypothetical protein [Bacillus thuringiensis]PEQ76577.1 hypothetical protein CN482_28915 [Bacillus cereus]PEY11301.1 hypothetical protein CN342_30230 [Bacillus cereus]PFM73864.1 hypothetical protein COJ54_24640 [Bacillus cereus]